MLWRSCPTHLLTSHYFVPSLRQRYWLFSIYRSPLMESHCKVCCSAAKFLVITLRSLWVILSPSEAFLSLHFQTIVSVSVARPNFVVAKNFPQFFDAMSCICHTSAYQCFREEHCVKHGSIVRGGGCRMYNRYTVLLHC